MMMNLSLNRDKLILKIRIVIITMPMKSSNTLRNNPQLKVEGEKALLHMQQLN